MVDSYSAGQARNQEECFLIAIPSPVCRFIEMIDLLGTEYIFAVTTHSGYPGKVGYHLQQRLKGKKARFDAYFVLKMIANTPAGLAPSWMINQKWAEKISQEHLTSLEKDLQPQLDEMMNTITSQATTPDEVKKWSLLDQLIQAFSIRMMKNRKSVIAFYPDSDCNGCGTISSSLPVGQG